MPLLVMKFGGTSVADLARIRNAAEKVKREVARGYDVIVIVSAMSGKTNELVGWVEQTSPLFDAREYDAVVSAGENVTAGLMALTLQEMDVPARSWQGWQVPINTTSAHSSARFMDIPRANIDAKFAEGFRVAVVAGFQGVSAEQRITTLGRGGSDRGGSDRGFGAGSDRGTPGEPGGPAGRGGRRSGGARGCQHQQSSRPPEEKQPRFCVILRLHHSKFGTPCLRMRWAATALSQALEAMGRKRQMSAARPRRRGAPHPGCRDFLDLQLP